MAAESLRLTTADRANLVAYLDGELTENEAHAMGQKLTQSVSARREVEILEATWALLDHLPRPQAPTDFVERTSSMATGAAILDDRLASLAAGSARKALKWAALAGCAVVASGVGYVAARWGYPDRTARLSRDLTIAERLDQYRDIGSIEFLRQLEGSTALDEPVAANTAPGGPAR